MNLFDGVEIPSEQEYPITRQDHIEIPPPDLSTVMNRKMKALKAEINCCQVGTVQAFYPATQTVDVTLNVHRIVETEVKQYPVLVQVPVFIPSGGESRLTMPIVPGDQCIVLFCDRSIEAWATAGTVAAPTSERTHDLSDGVAIVGFFPASGPLSGVNQNGPELRNGNALVSVEGGKIRIFNGSLSLGLEMAAMWASKILMTAAHVASHNALKTLCAALAGDSGLNSTSRAAASAAAGVHTTTAATMATQGAIEQTQADNIGMIIDGSSVGSIDGGNA